MDQFLVLIRDGLVHLYLPLFVVGFFAYQRLGGGIITVTWITVFNLYAYYIEHGVWDWAISLAVEYRFIAWFGVWWFVAVLFVVSLLGILRYLKIPIVSVAYRVCIAYFALMFLHTTAFINVTFFEFDWADTLYSFSVPAINIGIVIVIASDIAMTMIKKYRIPEHSELRE